MSSPSNPSRTSWPGTAEQVRDWIRAMLRPEAGQQWAGLDRLQIQPQVDGADLTHLRLDATGLQLRALPGEAAKLTPLVQPAPAVVSFQTGRLRELEVTARPVRVQGYELTLALRASNIDIDWTAYAGPLREHRPETAYAITAHDDQPAMTATLDASMRQKDLVPMIREAMNDLTKGSGVTLRALKLRLATPEPGIITAEGVVSARMKFIGMRVRASIVVRYSPDGVLVLETLRLRSLNPIIALALRLTRRFQGRTIDLNEQLGTGSARIRDLRVEAGDVLRVSARVGQA